MTILSHQKKAGNVALVKILWMQKRVSQQLNIDHKILYYQKKFKKEVIDSFVDSYVAGETPIPCVQCKPDG